MKTRVMTGMLVLILCIGVVSMSPADVSGFTINTGNYQDMSTYPGIHTFDYAATPVRENIPADSMVDPEYTFRVMDKTVDEYFGTTGNNTNDGITRKGFYLKNNKKGQCGVRYNQLFRYQDDWIDVKTTYIDWDVNNASKAFVTGGFCRFVWTNVHYVRLRHEFFVSGTDEPVDIKGFFTFTDVDNSQGIGMLPSDVKKLWTNQNGSVLKYKNTVEGYLFVKDMRGSVVAGPSAANYNPAEAAKVTFSYAFEGTTHDQFILDGRSDSSFNVIGFETAKVIPSDIPAEGSEAIRKQVSGDGEEYQEKTCVRSWEAQWKYRIAALLPMETEEGNLLDGFCITDEIDSCLSIDEVKILRGSGSDVSDLFDISIDDHVIRAEAIDMSADEIYGYMYYMLVDVSLSAGDDEVKQHGHFTDDFTAVFRNTATVSYTDGNGTYDRKTNEVETEVVYPYRADITITKKIKTDELWWDHGVPSFIIELKGTTALDQEEVERHEIITFSREYVREHSGDAEYISRSVTFTDVEEGTYECSENETLRYELDRIEDVKGGRVKGSKVLFEIDDDKGRAASFVNTKSSWNDYSDSRCVVNSIAQ
ncbi:MAG: hypothetical protein Q4A65_04525 [Bacillota bacterium]|nr:hypothetical protein [Bacillota bacterium]